MKKIFFLAAGLLMAAASFAQSPSLRLWYKQPARVWTEALPVGNGRLGGMVFGGVQEELIQLNEATLWSGGPVKENVNPEAFSYLEPTRAALFSGDYQKGEQLAKKMQGFYSESYLPLGDLRIRQQVPGFDSSHSSYYRDLDIAQALATTSFTAAGITYTREVFASAPEQVLVIRFTASKRGALDAQVLLRSQLVSHNEVAGTAELRLVGKAPSHVDPSYVRYNKQPIVQEDSTGCRGMRFSCTVRAIAKDGTLSADTSGITIRHASEVVLLVSAATSFNGFDKCPDRDGKDEQALDRFYQQQARRRSYTQIKQRHLQDFHRYFNRVSLVLNQGDGNTNAGLPTDERLERYTRGAKDNALEALYFQLGRYLLIASSRTPQVPANLQGIWNKEMRPPWSANFTININTQMNYWPAEVANLTEMTQPLLGFVENLARTGRVTAQQFYHAGGWVAHHNSDIWALSNPVGDKGHGDPKWANWSMGANWLCRHLWDHYLFTRDTTFLRDTAYPLMKGAAEFCFDWLVKDSNGYLVTAPAVSPENTFLYNGGKKGGVSVATTMDMSIIRDLLRNLLQATQVLQTNQPLQDTLKAKLALLYPLHKGSKGNLQEWYQDWEDEEPHHRHVSQLYGLHPGYEISPVSTPEWAAAAKKTLELRGDDGTGWSLAWKINFWARLLDGDHAYQLLHDLLRLVHTDNTNYREGGGSYPNLFCAHPPFQIDGNFGGTAGIAEMLLQSQSGELHLLPALPTSWKSGQVKGLKARGNFTVNMQWQHYRLQQAVVTAVAGGACTIRTATPVRLKGSSMVSHRDRYSYLLTFPTQKGGAYVLNDTATPD